MKLAIIGSRNLHGDPFTCNLLELIVSMQEPTDNEEYIIITGRNEGDGKGVDQMVAFNARTHWGKEYLAKLLTFPPRNERWEPEGYKERNTKIAEECDVLYSIRSSKSETYGSGWTADHAEKLGKEVYRILLDWGG